MNIFKILKINIFYISSMIVLFFSYQLPNKVPPPIPSLISKSIIVVQNPSRLDKDVHLVLPNRPHVLFKIT